MDCVSFTTIFKTYKSSSHWWGCREDSSQLVLSTYGEAMILWWRWFRFSPLDVYNLLFSNTNTPREAYSLMQSWRRMKRRPTREKRSGDLCEWFSCPTRKSISLFLSLSFFFWLSLSNCFLCACLPPSLYLLVMPHLNSVCMCVCVCVCVCG